MMTQIGQTYTFSGSTLTCPICKQTYFEQEQASLVQSPASGAMKEQESRHVPPLSRVLAPPKVFRGKAPGEQAEAQTEDILPHADIFICANCGYILWFLPAEIGQPGRSYIFLESPLQCAFCQQHEFTTYKAPLNTRSASFMQFNWIYPPADTYICTYCGTILWLFIPETGRPGQAYEISGRQLTCRSCAQIQFRERETLIHSRTATLSDTAWVASSAKNYICTLCSSMYWFA